MRVTDILIASALAAETETNTETGVADHAAEELVFPPFDGSFYPSQLLWLAITFGGFYLVMKKVLVPRVGGILEMRRDRIAQDLDEASRLKGDADEAIAAYEQELADARAKAGQIAATARDKAKSEADAERTRTEADLTEKLAAADAKIRTVKDKALGEVGDIASELTGEIVQRLIGVSGSKKDISQAIGRVANPGGV